MPYFGTKSLSRLNTCDEQLQVLFKAVVKDFDCTVTEGYRNEEDQNKYYDKGKTKLRYPLGNHNHKPSRAVDVYPYPINTTDRDRFHFFAGYVKSVADQLGIKIRWGGNWSNDLHKGFRRNKFDDLVLFELVE